MNKTVRYAVAFAQFAKENKFDPTELGELVSLAKAVIRAGAAMSSGRLGTTKTYEFWQAKFEKAAAKLGFTVIWDSCIPKLVRPSGAEFWLPID